MHDRFTLSLVFLAAFWIVVQAGTSLGLTSGRLATSASTGSTARPPVPAIPTSQQAVAAVSTPYVPVLPQSIHTYATLDDFIDDAQANVNDYWLHQPFPADRPYTAPRVRLMQQDVPVPCATSLTQWTSFYCPAEQTIYLPDLAPQFELIFVPGPPLQTGSARALKILIIGTEGLSSYDSVSGTVWLPVRSGAVDCNLRSRTIRASENVLVEDIAERPPLDKGRRLAVPLSVRSATELYSAVSIQHKK